MKVGVLRDNDQLVMTFVPECLQDWLAIQFFGRNMPNCLLIERELNDGSDTAFLIPFPIVAEPAVKHAVGVIRPPRSPRRRISKLTHSKAGKI